MDNNIGYSYSILFRSFMGFVLGGGFKRSAELELHIYQGLKYYSKSQWELSWKRFILAEHLAPNEPRVIFYLANIYFRMKRYDYAYDYCKRFEQIPEDFDNKSKFLIEIRLLHANINVILGRTTESIDNFSKLLEETKEHEKEIDEMKNERSKQRHKNRLESIKYVGYKNIARILTNEKDYENALENFDKALDIYPEEGEIYFDKGLVSFLRNDFQGAVEHFSNALEKGYASEEIYFKRAYSYIKLANYKEARVDLRKVVFDYPEGDYYNSAMSFIDTIKSFQ